MKLYGFSRPDAVGRSLQEAIQYPSLNIRGLHSGFVGQEARAIIPDRAVAAIQIRSVVETANDGLLTHIRKHGYHIVHQELTTQSLPSTRESSG